MKLAQWHFWNVWVELSFRNYVEYQTFSFPKNLINETIKNSEIDFKLNIIVLIVLVDSFNWFLI